MGRSYAFICSAGVTRSHDETEVPVGARQTGERLTS